VHYLDTPIEFLKGVGPLRAGLLRKEAGISTFADLLSFYPFRYIDRSKFYKINEVSGEMPYVQIRGTISGIKLHGERRTTRMTALLSDDTGELELVWFRGFKWLKDQFKSGVEYIVFGKPTLFGRRINIAHPEVEPVTPVALNQLSSMQAVYNSSEQLRAKGLDSKGIGRLVKTLLPLALPHIGETLPKTVLQALKLPGRQDSLLAIHFPSDAGTLKKAVARLKFEELFLHTAQPAQKQATKARENRGTCVSVHWKAVQRVLP
jgi:ATP-dependent DNA helicase RecG